MRILSITAGAAGMYCGSCFRDNAVAAELIRQGHQVTLQPVYTPTRTDEENVSDTEHVLFGGLNVYLQQQSAMFRHLPGFVDRWLDRPSLIRSMSSRSVATRPALLGGLTVSMLEGSHGALRREFDKLVAWMRHEPVPDVINLPNSLLIAMAEPLARATGRPVCCTLQGEELFLEGLHEPYRSRALDLIRSQVHTVDRFIAVSDHESRFMSSYLGIDPARLSVVPLGIRFDGYERREPRRAGPPRIGYFARIAPEKGLHVLADAYVRLRRKMGNAAPVLSAAGYMSAADEPYLAGIVRGLTEKGCVDGFTYAGSLDRAEKIAFLRTLDVLAVPATYDEPKGLFLIEAMACGVPVVEPRRGALAEIVERTGGGMLVTPDDPEALAGGLERVLTDHGVAEALSVKAYDGVRAHYDVRRSVERLVSVYDGVIAKRTC